MYVSKCNGLMYNISCSTIISLRTAELPIQERSREEFNNRSNATSIKLFKLDTLHFCTLEKRIVWKKNRVESNWNAYKQRIIQGTDFNLPRPRKEAYRLYRISRGRGKMIKLENVIEW